MDYLMPGRPGAGALGWARSLTGWADYPEAQRPGQVGPAVSAGYLLSRIRVTGPSLTSSTCIIAPKRPVATGTPWARTASQNASYIGIASGGAAASMKLGRRPFRQSP